MCGIMDFRFCHSKLKIMENTNQRIKQKALCWFRKIGIDNIFSEASCNKWGLFNSAGREMTRITSDHMMYRALLTEKTKRIH